MVRLSVFALLLSASSAQAFTPVVCSSKGDREWTIDGKRITTRLSAETSVGVLKDEREVHRGKKWLVQFPGGQAFFTVAGGRYKLIFDNGDTTEGDCVSRSARQR